MTCPPCIKLRMLREAWESDRNDRTDILMDILHDFLRTQCKTDCENFGKELNVVTKEEPMVFFFPDDVGNC